MIDYHVTQSRDSVKADLMFQARKRMFVDRLGWDLEVDTFGRETDNYDTDEATYIIILDDQQRHKSSMRLLPVSSPCMTVEAFPGLFNRDMIANPDRSIEVTRFCVDPWTPEGAVELFAAGAEWLRADGSLDSFVAVFFPAMLRVYKKAGWSPKVLNKIHTEKDGVLMVGEWHKDAYPSDD